MAIEIPDSFQAGCTIVGNATTPTFQSQQGCGSLTRNSTGSYAITLDYPLNAGNCICFATAVGATAGSQALTVTHTSDTVKTISVASGGAVTDSMTFSVGFLKLQG